MLKKLQNLLFEEEIVEEEVEEEEVKPTSAPSTSSPVMMNAIKEEVVEESKPIEVTLDHQETSNLQPVVENVVPQVEEVKPTSSMKRIDVTQPLPTITSEPVHEKPKATLGITADNDFKPKEKKPSAKPTAKAARKDDKVTRLGTYQFQPVISPIFGVDEKDLKSLKTTTTRISEAEKIKTEENVSPIISPIYGRNKEDVPSSIQKTVEQSNAQEQLRATPIMQEVEDEIPEFSLDDILAGREDDLSEGTSYPNVPPTEDTDSLFPDLWSTELEDAEDSTVILETPKSE